MLKLSFVQSETETRHIGAVYSRTIWSLFSHVVLLERESCRRRAFIRIGCICLTPLPLMLAQAGDDRVDRIAATPSFIQFLRPSDLLSLLLARRSLATNVKQPHHLKRYVAAWNDGEIWLNVLFGANVGVANLCLIYCSCILFGNVILIFLKTQERWLRPIQYSSNICSVSFFGNARAKLRAYLRLCFSTDVDLRNGSSANIWGDQAPSCLKLEI